MVDGGSAVTRAIKRQKRDLPVGLRQQIDESSKIEGRLYMCKMVSKRR